MRFATKCTILTVLTICFSSGAIADGLREAVLRDAAIDAGLIPAAETHVATSQDLVNVGQLLFESRLLSLNNDTACASCHLDQFGSADGLPIAIGTEGEGVGIERVKNGGDIVPRNTLPFWGRGGVGFDLFFWDGKVDGTSGEIVSQFGAALPSHDPLVVAVHLPPAEIGEMVIDREATRGLQTEQVHTATQLYAELAQRVQEDQQLGSALAMARDTQQTEIEFLDIAEAIAAFIRSNFKVKSTRFHEFIFGDGALTAQEVRGGLLFYGRGGCAGCHNGPYFSDMDFHSIPFPQLGFGKNGFGIDYGRFNVTLKESDKYNFRTPPLYNVTKTAPYSHSGSIQTLSDAIRTHVDPLMYVNPQTMTANDRVEFYQRLQKWSQTTNTGVVMNNDDIDAIEAFLGTLAYESERSVRVVD
jgi:cytochrome c peroxidase